MSYLEADFCPRSEYEDGRESRITEFNEDELYMAMLSLTPYSQTNQAAKLPAEITQLTRLESGLWQASLVLMNIDLRPLLNITSQVEEGYLFRPGQTNTTFSLAGGGRVEEGYLRQFGCTMENQLQELLVSSGTAPHTEETIEKPREIALV